MLRENARGRPRGLGRGAAGGAGRRSRTGTASRDIGPRLPRPIPWQRRSQRGGTPRLCTTAEGDLCWWVPKVLAGIRPSG